MCLWGRKLLNMVLKDVSNKTGYKVVPARQIKRNNRRRRNSPGGVTGVCTVTRSLL